MGSTEFYAQPRANGGNAAALAKDLVLSVYTAYRRLRPIEAQEQACR